MTRIFRMLQMCSEADVECYAAYEERSKDQNLQAQASYDDRIPDVSQACLRLETGAARHYVETEPVADNKDPSRPAWRDHRDTFSSDRSHDSSVHHVQGCGEKDWRQ